MKEKKDQKQNIPLALNGHPLENQDEQQCQSILPSPTPIASNLLHEAESPMSIEERAMLHRRIPSVRYYKTSHGKSSIIDFSCKKVNGSVWISTGALDRLMFFVFLISGSIYLAAIVFVIAMSINPFMFTEEGQIYPSFGNSNNSL